MPSATSTAIRAEVCTGTAARYEPAGGPAFEVGQPLECAVRIEMSRGAEFSVTIGRAVSMRASLCPPFLPAQAGSRRRAPREQTPGVPVVGPRWSIGMACPDGLLRRSRCSRTWCPSESQTTERSDPPGTRRRAHHPHPNPEHGSWVGPRDRRAWSMHDGRGRAPRSYDGSRPTAASGYGGR